MGIKHLKKFLNGVGNSNLHIKEQINYGSHLHVDGLGWLFHILKSTEGLSILRQYGGSYVELDSFIRRSYYDLKSYGFNLSFYFDGNDSPMKSATRVERDSQHNESWEALYLAICAEDSSIDQMTLDLPPLTIQQFYFTLSSLGVQGIHCKYEADQKMALACKTANEISSVANYCLGDDTDYIVMSSCPYIEIGTFSKANKTGMELITATVWRRDKLSKQLGMNESQFVEWCIIIGNDYTKHLRHAFKIDDSGNDSTLGKKNGGHVRHELYGDVEDLRKLIISKGPNFLLSSDNEELKLAIEYSRAVYDLKDLTSFDESADNADEVSGSDEEEEEDEGEYCDGYLLTDRQTQLVKEWKASIAPNSLSSERLGCTVVRFLRHNLEKYEKEKPAMGILTTGQTDSHRLLEVGGDENPFPDITRLHLDALDAMHEQLSLKIGSLRQQELDLMRRKLSLNLPSDTPDRYGSVQSGKTSGAARIPPSQSQPCTAEKPSGLQWIDVRAARTYQLLCKKLVPRSESQIDPMHVYDGIMFHSAMSQLRARQEAAMLTVMEKLSKLKVKMSQGTTATSSATSYGALKEDSSSHEQELSPGTFLDSGDEYTSYDQVAHLANEDLLTISVEKLQMFVDQISDMKHTLFRLDAAYLAARLTDGKPSTDTEGIKAALKNLNEFNAVYLKAVKVSVTLKQAIKTKLKKEKKIPSKNSKKTKPEESAVNGANEDQKDLESMIPSGIPKKESPPSALTPVLTPKSAKIPKSNETNSHTREQKAPTSGPSAMLPIDEHKDLILHTIDRDRVTIIQGDTGCGKSSRLPVMLLEDAENREKNCRMMISQPRRIAATALMDRLRLTLGNRVGLRMGGGVRDETEDTIMHFVTSGYILRLIAHRPEYFENYTHIIIDEVHERSIDGDLLCMLTRRLLFRYPYLKLILMSATLHTDLYKTYFNEIMTPHTLEPIFVGVRRFPIETFYAEDLLSEGKTKKLPSTLLKSVSDVISLTEEISGDPKDDVPITLGSLQLQIAVPLIHSIARLGSDILVFFSGLGDMELLTNLFVTNQKYQLCYIHSEIPFEEQRKAFLPALSGKIKLIIANNSAVSSVTFPDVDTVICLGTYKTLRYSHETHKVHLANTWISKATATQRAGRTGRVRPGVVYRLYSRALSDRLQEHDESEITSKPLEGVILSIWSLTEDSNEFPGIVPTLSALPQSPEPRNVDFSLRSLKSTGMITHDNGEGCLTSLGKFAGGLPLDLGLGMLIHYGVSLGVGAESVVFAAALSLRGSLFHRTTFFMKQKPTHYNDVIRTCYLACVQLDDGAYSEPVMHLYIYRTWMSMNVPAQNAWARSAGIRVTEMRQFVSTVKHLLQTVNNVLRGQSEQGGADNGTWCALDERALRGDHVTSARELNMYRIILTWTSAGDIIKQTKTKSKTPDSVIIPKSLSPENLDLLYPDCHRVRVKGTKGGAGLGQKSKTFCIPRRISIKVTTTYEADLSTSRLSCSLDALLCALISSRSEHGPDGEPPSRPVVWVVQLPSMPPQDSDQDPTQRVPGPEYQASSTIVTVAYPLQRLCVLGTDKNLDPTSVLEKIFSADPGRWVGPEALVFKGSEGEGGLGQGETGGSAGSSGGRDSPPLGVGYVIRQANRVSSDELDALSKLHCSDSPIASMTLPPIGPAEVTISNYIASRHSLESIFFSDSMNTEDREGEVEGKGSRIIREHTTKLRQTLSFPAFSFSPKARVSRTVTVEGSLNSDGMTSLESSSTLDNYSSVEVLGSGLESESESGSTDSSLTVCAGIVDIPLGIRLMNSYKMGHKDLDLRLSKGESGGAFEAAKVVKVITAISGWTTLNSTPCLLSRHSVPAAATHTGTETLYGVCSSSFLVKGKTGKMCWIMDGVTLLPPGELWVSVALACVGRNIKPVVPLEQGKSSKKNKNKKKTEERTSEKRTIEPSEEEDERENLDDLPPPALPVLGTYYFSGCKVVSEYLSGLKALPLQRDDELIQAVDYLFQDWINAAEQK